MLKPGIYRHFKGNFYQVIDLVRHSETEEQLVLYRALYGERGLWVRPRALFEKPAERDGQPCARFVWFCQTEEELNDSL